MKRLALSDLSVPYRRLDVSSQLTQQGIEDQALGVNTVERGGVGLSSLPTPARAEDVCAIWHPGCTSTGSP